MWANKKCWVYESKGRIWYKTLVFITATPSVKFKNTYIDIVNQPTKIAE